MITDGERNQVLQLAASLEYYSDHPLASAVIDAAAAQRQSVTNFTTLPGLGVTGQIAGTTVALGNAKLMQQQNIAASPLFAQAAALSTAGKTLIYVAQAQKLVGVLGVTDPIKADSPAAIKRLQHLGVDVVMLTGDNRPTAEAIAAQAGIKQVISDVLPEGKADAIKTLQQQGHKVAMVGDGINDAPALVQAEIGVAIGNGTDVAVDSAEVILMNSDLSSLVTARELSRKTMINIKENLFWAFFYNVLGIPVALGLLYLFGGPLLNPMIAAGAMGFSSVTVVLNALRLNRFKIKKLTLPERKLS